MRLYGLDKQLRFQSVAELLHDGETILDVGGGRGDFFNFAICSGIIADLSPDKSLFGRVRVSYPFVTFDGLSLPFKDRSFDTVVCLDTLEHVSKAKRGGLLRELQRVSRSRIILTFPERQFFFPVLFAVACLYDRLRLNSFMLKSLKEHSRFGLPSKDEILGSVDAGKWMVHHSSFMSRRATLFWIMQLLFPFLATARVNKMAADLLSLVRDRGGSERLITLERLENKIRF
jgi:hypothetical protein